MSITKELIDDFLSKDTKVSDYRTALTYLKRSGFLDLIRRLGHPNVIDNGSNLNAMAHEGSWSNGFQTALNQLEFFEKFYANQIIESPIINPTFGGAAIAKKEGYLSEKEIEKVTNKGDKK